MMLAIAQGTQENGREGEGRRQGGGGMSACHPSFLFAYIFSWDAGKHVHQPVGLHEPGCPSLKLGRYQVKVCWVPARVLSFQEYKFRKVDTPACQECHHPMLIVNTKRAVVSWTPDILSMLNNRKHLGSVF